MNIPSSDIRRDARCEKGDFSLWFVARVLVVSFRVQSASCTRHHYRVTTLDRRHRRPAPRSLLPALLACGRNCIRRSSFCSGELDTRRKKKRPGRHCHWAHGVLRHLPANSSWRRAAKSAGGCWRRVWQGCAAQLATERPARASLSVSTVAIAPPPPCRSTPTHTSARPTSCEVRWRVHARNGPRARFADANSPPTHTHTTHPPHTHRAGAGAASPHGPDVWFGPHQPAASRLPAAC